MQENSTFEDEQNYQQQLQKYNAAQDNLSTLEKYLNAYDKISKIQFIRDLLADTSSKIDAAETTKDINAILTEYEYKLISSSHPHTCIITCVIVNSKWVNLY